MCQKKISPENHCVTPVNKFPFTPGSYTEIRFEESPLKTHTRAKTRSVTCKGSTLDLNLLESQKLRKFLKTKMGKIPHLFKILTKNGLNTSLTSTRNVPTRERGLMGRKTREKGEKYVFQKLSNIGYYVPILRYWTCLLYTSPSPRDRQKSRMPSSA